jgi:drug/metabolite transporter (DMT)-like permease
MAITMSVPIFAALLAIPLLGEKVGWHRWAAIAIGFIGVIIALNPAAPSRRAASTPGRHALLGHGRHLREEAERHRSPTPSSSTTWATGALIATCFLPWVWVTPTLRCSAFISRRRGRRHRPVTMTFAMKLAPASVASPFEYTQIAWAVLFDMALWGVAPPPPR